MPNFSLYLPDKVLQDLDKQRGLTPRSRVITKLLERCIETPGYLEEISQSILKEQCINS